MLYGKLNKETKTLQATILPSASYLTAKINVTQGGSSGQKKATFEPVEASMATFIPDIETIIGNAELLPYENWNYWQETDNSPKTTTTLTAKATAECLLVVAVMHRDTVSIVGDGWEKVVTSLTGTGGGVSQYITVWSKRVEAGTYEVTVNQVSSVRMMMKILAVYDAVSVSVVDNVLWSATPYTPTPTTGNRRIYLTSSVYAGSGNAVVINDTGELDIQKAETGQFSAFYDYQPELSITPSFTSGMTLSGISTITLDVDEDYTYLFDSEDYMLIDSEDYILTV